MAEVTVKLTDAEAALVERALVDSADADTAALAALFVGDGKTAKVKTPYAETELGKAEEKAQADFTLAMLSRHDFEASELEVARLRLEAKK